MALRTNDGDKDVTSNTIKVADPTGAIMVDKAVKPLTNGEHVDAGLVAIPRHWSLTLNVWNGHQRVCVRSWNLYFCHWCVDDSLVSNCITDITQMCSMYMTAYMEKAL